LAIRFETFSDIDRFIEISPQIRTVLGRFEDSLFFSPDWLIPFQKTLCGDRDVSHIAGWDEQGNLQGTIHLSVVSTPFLKIFRPKVLAFLGTRSVVSPEHLEFPIVADSHAEWFTFLEEFIRDEMSLCSFVVFDSVAEDAENVVAAMDHLKRKGFRIRRDLQDTCPYLDLPASYDDLIASYSANMRKIIRRTFRRVGDNLRLVDHGEMGGIDTALAEARRLHNLARAEKGDFGSFDRGGYMEFHSELARSIADKGKLYVKFLMNDDKAVAFRYGFIDGGVYYDYQTGYDPAFAESRPGFIMVAMIIEDLISRGVKRFDFLRGDEYYKRHWAKKDRNTYRYYVFPPGKQSWIYYILLKIYRGWR